MSDQTPWEKRALFGERNTRNDRKVLTQNASNNMSNTDQQQPTVTVSLSRKINLGNYESADVFVCVSGVPEGATKEEIDALLDTGNLAYNRLREHLTAKIMDTRAESKKPA